MKWLFQYYGVRLHTPDGGRIGADEDMRGWPFAANRGNGVESGPIPEIHIRYDQVGPGAPGFENGVGLAGRRRTDLEAHFLEHHAQKHADHTVIFNQKNAQD